MNNQPRKDSALTGQTTSVAQLDIDAAENATENDSSDAQPRRSLFVPVLFILIATIIASGWVFKSELKSRLQVQGFFLAEQRLSQFEQQVVQNEQKFELIGEQLVVLGEGVEQVQLLQPAVDQLNENLARVKRRVDQVEVGFTRQQAGAQLLAVRQLLFVADQQLRLAGDRRFTLQAFDQADRVLLALNDGQWLPLREMIAAEVSGLQALPVIDFSGVSFRLNQLALRIDELSGVNKITSAASTVSQKSSAVFDGEIDGWRLAVSRAWQQLLDQLSTLVKIDRITGDEPVLITIEQIQGLKFNLQARLLLAELDFAHGRSGFGERLLVVKSSVQKYFDMTDPPVVAIVAELEALSKAPVSIEYPDISQPLVWLDKQIADGER